MTNKSKHINVRFDGKLYGIVEKVAADNRMTKSDVVRSALEGELDRIDARKNKSLSADEREKMLKNMGIMMTNLSKMQNQNARLGNNINQITKAINRGEQSVSAYELTEYVKFKNALDLHMDAISKELDRIWHTLV